jgi:hypothetical protein
MQMSHNIGPHCRCAHALVHNLRCLDEHSLPTHKRKQYLELYVRAIGEATLHIRINGPRPTRFTTTS